MIHLKKARAGEMHVDGTGSGLQKDVRAKRWHRRGCRVLEDCAFEQGLTGYVVGAIGRRNGLGILLGAGGPRENGTQADEQCARQYEAEEKFHSVSPPMKNLRFPRDDANTLTPHAPRGLLQFR